MAVLRKAGERGSALVIVLALVIVFGGLSMAMLLRTVGTQRATVASVIETRLLFIAETALNYNFIKMQEDPTYVVSEKDSVGTSYDYKWDSVEKEYISDVIDLSTDGGKTSHTFQYRVTYYNGDDPVQFADRENPNEGFNRIRVVGTASFSGKTRTVAAWYTLKVNHGLDAAIVSDMIPIGPVGSGKKGGKNGHINIESNTGDQHVIFGNIKANGSIVDNGTVITDANVASHVLSMNGSIESGLAGTEDEIPDMTTLGGNDFFDFDRYKAAAQAGAGQTFPHIKAFINAMNGKNAAGEPLEGIIYVNVDPASPNNYNIDATELPGGINIRGTLIFRFADGTDPDYRTKVLVPLSINAADLSGWNPTDESTYTTGYPPTFSDPARAPYAVDISPKYVNFTKGEDIPALMYNNAVLDMHDHINICGVVYSAGFLEVENKNGEVMYFNGAILAGGGVLLESKNEDADSVIAVRYDPGTVGSLQVNPDNPNLSHSLKRTGFTTMSPKPLTPIPVGSKDPVGP